MEARTIVESVDVEAALLHSSLVPPPAPDSLAPGATADLRMAMARFSSGEDHVAPRAAVEKAITELGGQPFINNARHRTSEILDAVDASTAVDAIADIGYVVPVDTLAFALGVAEDDLASVRAQVAAIVAVIGRREASSDASDDASTDLLQRLQYLGHDPVATASLLYQCHDACCAMFASILVADQTNQRRRPALAATSRLATEDVTIGAHQLPQGTTVVVDLESPRLEFGLGAHHCPGRGIAEQLVLGMVEAVRSAGRQADMDAVRWRDDQRAQTLPLRSVR